MHIENNIFHTFNLIKITKTHSQNINYYNYYQSHLSKMHALFIYI